MFDERVLANLDVLDHLQLYGSTVKVAELMGLSQSSCSRRYRALSDLFGLCVDRSEGGYEPRRNIDVLADMRQVAQKLRVRRSVLRCSLAWQVKGLELPSEFRLLDLASLATSQALSVLEGRLVDVWVGGLHECQPLISASLEVLQSNRLALGQSLLALPLLRWEYVLVSHRTHPLQRATSITPDDFSKYPSQALPLGVAPLFTRALQEHGLASCTHGSNSYNLGSWESIASDCHSLTVVPPYRLPELEKQLGLVPLPYKLGIHEVIAVVGHRDAIADPCFVKAFHSLRDALRQSSIGCCSYSSWLR
jgi:DNA-binding transcriptional LysR family regulator